MAQLDPRLVEIDILSEADRAFVSGPPGYQYTKANPSGPEDWQRDEALRGLLQECALVSTSAGYNGVPVQGRPTDQVEHAASIGITELLKGRSIINLQITQIGRLRLYRLRDEILQRDRVRDDFNVLWAKRHFLPDLEVRLRFRDPKDPLSVILLDVDKLKTINTELGHPGADTVLTAIFEILRDVVRPHDAYRLGGDEAGAVLPGVSLEAGRKLAEEIRATIEARVWPSDLLIQTKPTVSVGVGTYTRESPVGAEDLYRAVDVVCDRAKKSGKNRVEAADVPEVT